MNGYFFWNDYRRCIWIRNVEPKFHKLYTKDRGISFVGCYLISRVYVSYRLLRNRVSAQQARERKKAYLSELEVRVKDLEKKNSELEERLSTLQNENQMLRHVHLSITSLFTKPYE